MTNKGYGLSVPLVCLRITRCYLGERIQAAR